MSVPRGSAIAAAANVAAPTCCGHRARLPDVPLHESLSLAAVGHPAPPFHESYWLAIAAAAPIIALANQITLTETLRTREFFKRVLRSSGLPDAIRDIVKPGQRATSYAYWIGGLNMMMQGLVLVLALASLSELRDALPMILGGIGVAGGIGLIVYTSGFSARGASAREQLELEDWKPSTSPRTAAKGQNSKGRSRDRRGRV